MSVDAGENPAGLKGCFNQYGTGPAARVVKRLTGLPSAQLHQSGSQWFAKRSFSVPGTVSAAGKGFTGCIQQDPHQVGMDGNQHRESRTVFRKNPEPGFRLQPGANATSDMYRTNSERHRLTPLVE